MRFVIYDFKVLYVYVIVLVIIQVTLFISKYVIFDCLILLYFYVYLA